MRVSPAHAIWRNDLLLEVRNRQFLGLTLMFAVLIPLMFRAASEAGAVEAAPVPVLWVTLLFVTVGGLGRSFHIEAERGMLDALLASPATASELFEGKMISGFVVSLIAGFVSLGLTSVFIDSALLRHPVPVASILFVGCFALAILAALVSALTARSRARAALMPVVALPLALPMILLGVQGMQAVVSETGSRSSLITSTLGILGYCSLLLLAGTYLASRALED